ncbi:MAG: hypothetical protein IT439_11875 [Phycisphaerales bacterium]|nr:hypothetical protein [Phycisphaerales bacterium]
MCIATYRQANGSGGDTYPKEQWVHHNAGLAGLGSSSYIDAVILRDDHEDDWTEAADSTLERRVYYCQNWRADVVALLAENGRVVERAWYEPYGTPHGLNPGDFGGTSSSGDDHYLVPDGDSDSDDATTYLALFGGGNALSDTTGSSDPGDGEYGRPNGVIDSDDYFYFLDRAGDAVTLGRNVLSAGHDGAIASHGAGNLRNRRGLAGYEWDPHVRRYHVRNRLLYPEIGRWTRRDPLGYVDGMGLYAYCRGSPALYVDALGLDIAGCAQRRYDNITRGLSPSFKCASQLRSALLDCCTTLITSPPGAPGFDFAACVQDARSAFDDCCGSSNCPPAPAPAPVTPAPVAPAPLPAPNKPGSPFPPGADCMKQCETVQLIFTARCFNCPLQGRALCSQIAARGVWWCLNDCASLPINATKPARDYYNLMQRTLAACDSLSDLQDILDLIPRSGTASTCAGCGGGAAPH